MSKTIRPLWAAVGLAAALTVAQPATVHASPRAEAVLAQLGFSAAERKRILAGDLITTTSKEKTSDRELAVTMAFLINNPPPDLAAMFAKAATGALSPKDAMAEANTRAKQIFDKWRQKKMVGGGGKDK